VGKMDAGPVLAQDATDISPDESAGELHDRLAILGVQTVKSAISLIEQDENSPGIPQDESMVTLAPKLKKPDGYLNFALPALQIFNHIRGMTPWPGAIAIFVSALGRQELVTIVRSRVSTGLHDTALLSGILDAQLHVSTLEGALEVTEIQPASGRLMSWSDFVNGRRVRPGDRFETPG